MATIEAALRKVSHTLGVVADDLFEDFPEISPVVRVCRETVRPCLPRSYYYFTTIAVITSIVVITWRSFTII